MRFSVDLFGHGKLRILSRTLRFPPARPCPGMFISEGGRALLQVGRAISLATFTLPILMVPTFSLPSTSGPPARRGLCNLPVG